MRGRLIQKFRVALYRLNTKATEAASDYDDIFREPVKAQTGDGIGTLQRSEHAVEYVPCQIGNRRWEKLSPDELGDDAASDFVVYFFMKDLEDAGLVDSTTKRPLVGVGDRIASIRSYRDSSEVVLSFSTPPGMYCVEATPSGWGLSMSNPQVNLLRCQFRSRSATSQR